MKHLVAAYEKQHHSVVKRGASKFLKRWDVVTDSEGNKILPYAINSTMGDLERQGIADTAERFKQFTCIRLRERTTEESYVYFTPLSGCWSNVGRIHNTGYQKISLGRNCHGVDIVTHEVLHAIGFWHEQSRPDRDEYVYINESNVQPNRLFNFAKYDQGEIDSMGSPYDLLSVMHYGPYAFNKNGLPTILDINTMEPIVKGKGITTEDIRQVNLLYNCGKENYVCDRPDLPQVVGNGRILEEADSFVLGEKVNLQCDEGYSPLGEDHAFCGNWGFTQATLTCVKDGCKRSDFPIIAGDGYIMDEETDFFDIGDTIEMICGQGFSPLGSTTSTCTENGFSPTSFTCNNDDRSLCVDRNKGCAGWSISGFCLRTHVSYMSNNCKQSCDLCDDALTPENDCEDISPFCGIWKNVNKHCEKENHYEKMLKLCPRTCELCPLRSTACERESLNLVCEGGKVIKIEASFYGRIDATTCPSSIASQNTVPTSGCSSTTALSKTQAECDTKTSCDISSSNAVFGDPCPGVVKYLSVEFYCVDP